MNRRTFLSSVVSAIVGAPLYQKFLAWRNPVKRAVPGKIDWIDLENWFRMEVNPADYTPITGLTYYNVGGRIGNYMGIDRSKYPTRNA